MKKYLQDLEFIKTFCCLSDTDIHKVYVNEPVDMLDHIVHKYYVSREEYKQFGNIHFLCSLDNERATMLIEYVKNKQEKLK